MSAPSTLPPPVSDAAEAYPDLRRLKAALTARDWPAARAVLDAAEPAGRSLLISHAGDTATIEPFLRGVLAADPDDSTACALLGSHIVRLAWTIRSGHRAEHVSREQFRDFHAELRRAEQVLIDGAARTPADPAIWCQRMPTARGLQLGLSEARRRYDRLAALDPHHLPGQTHMLQTLCPKWSGSFEQVHAFARERMLAAPKGAPNAVLVVQGHLEHWGELDGRSARDRYLADPSTRNEVYEAATRSVWDPGFRHGPGWVLVRNTFALMFSLFSDERAAAAQFQAVGPYAGENPWHFFGDPSAEFVKRRNRAYAKAGAR